MSNISTFIISERENYLGEDNNLFAFSFGQALDYLDFIVIIADRHKRISREMVLNSKKMMESHPRSGPVTDEQMALLDEGRRLHTLVHLEIESFYLFAKILLDKVALFLQDYFGQVRGISLRSHDKLAKYYIQYGVAKGLIYPG